MRNSARGYTMVELLVATAVISILIILMMNFVAGRIAENARRNAISDLQLQAKLTLDVINRDIKHSANVDDQNRWEDDYSPTSPSNNFGWISDNDTLVIARPASSTSNNIIYEDPQTYISYKDNLVYFVNNNTLFKRILAAEVANNSAQTTCPSGTAGCGTDIKLADNTVGFTATYYDSNDNIVAPSLARSVAINLRLERTVFGRLLNEEQTIRTVFRNE